MLSAISVGSVGMIAVPSGNDKQMDPDGELEEDRCDDAEPEDLVLCRERFVEHDDM